MNARNFPVFPTLFLFLLLPAFLTLLLPAAATAQVEVRLPEDAPPPLLFARDEILNEAGKAAAPLTVTARFAERVPESFRLYYIREGELVAEGADVRGLMYALLEAAEQLLIKGRVDPKNETPFLKYRMLKFNPPLRGNTYLSEEDAANSAWFFDLEYWDRFFAMMAKARYNVVSFWHSHPFGNAVPLEKYPEAAVYRGEEMDRAVAFWHELYRLAHDHGVDVYWVTWNIHVTPGFAEAHGIADRNVDSPLVRDYMKECVRAMLREYPEIDGFGTCPSEAMGGMTQEARESFIRECYLEPMGETGRSLPFIHRYWGGAPGTVAAMLLEADYPADVLLDIKYNGEHMYSSPAPHLKDRSWLEQDPRPYEILWHLRNDCIYQLNWGDPEFASETILNCDGAAGFVMGSEVEVPGIDRYHTEETAWHKTWKYTFEKHWFRWMVWGRMGYNPRMGEAAWRGRYTAKYGKEIGTHVYEATKTASKIIPLVTSFHWNYMNGDWYPEGNVGSWNTSAEMPRRNFRPGGMWHDLDSYIFNNTIDDRFMSIPELVALIAAGNKLPELRMTVTDVASALMSYAEEVADRCEKIEQIAFDNEMENRQEVLRNKGIDPALDCDLMDLSTSAALGIFYSANLKAARDNAYHLFGLEGVMDNTPNESAGMAALYWKVLADFTDTHYLPHEVWLMGRFSWGMYTKNAQGDLDWAGRWNPIPREERTWTVDGQETVTVRWGGVGDPVKDAWIAHMNDVAGRIRVKGAAEAVTYLSPPEGRAVKVSFLGAGLVEGLLPGGKKLTPEAPSAVIEESGDLVLRLDPEQSGNGFHITDHPVPKVSDQIVIPANTGRLTAPFELIQDPGSLHGGCINVPKGVGHGKEGYSGPLIDNGWADFSFEVPLTTQYACWGRVVFRDGDSNSFFVKVDGLGPHKLADDVWNEWHWVRLPREIFLIEGLHSLQVRNREDGVKLDEIRFIPVGLDEKACLPKPFTDELEILDQEEVNKQMATYFHAMTPIRPPRHTDSLAAWEAHRLEVRTTVLHDIGLDPMPEGIALDPHIAATLDRDGYRLHRLYFQLLPGCYGSGWLYVPDRIEGKAPAVLNPHGHWTHRAYDVTPQMRLIAMAKKGYICLMTDNIHAGDLETGMVPIGLMTLQNLRALDYLLSREDVDPDRVGITGASGGGQQTLYMMAVDDRLKAAAPVVMASYFERILSPDQWHCWCNHAPGIAADTDEIELCAVFAPRPAYFLCSTRDWTSKFPDEEFKELQKVWALYGAEGLVGCEISDVEHGYERPRREAVYRFMNEHLGVKDPDGGAEPEGIAPEKIETLQAMDVPMEGLRDWTKAVAWYRGQHRPSAVAEEIPVRLSKLLRSVPPEAGGRPEAGQAGAETTGPIAYEGGVAERLLIRSEGELNLPALFIPATDVSAHELEPAPDPAADRAPAVVLLLPEGKAGAFTASGRPVPLVSALLDGGVHVLAVDVRLTGELARNWDRNCLAWGRPEAGMAADDAAWAAQYLRTREDVDPGRIAVAGLGRKGVSALLAATLHDFSACLFDGMERSFATHPVHDSPGYHAGVKELRDLGLPPIPHILQVADLPAIAAACKAPVAVINPGSMDYGSTVLQKGDEYSKIAEFLRDGE